MLVDQYGMLGLAMMYKHREDTPNELDKNIAIVMGKGQAVQSIVQQTNKNIDMWTDQDPSLVYQESLIEPASWVGPFFSRNKIPD